MHWANDPDDPEPVAILDAHRHLEPRTAGCRRCCTHLRASPNTRTGYFATVTSCVGFMDSPTVAAGVPARPGRRVQRGGVPALARTLYLVGGAGDSRLAPLSPR